MSGTPGLPQYGAGRYMDYDEAEPEMLAAAIAAEITRPVSVIGPSKPTAPLGPPPASPSSFARRARADRASCRT